MSSFFGSRESRALLVFFGGVLVSEEFVSSFKIDATDFDAARIKQIVKGKTSRNEVLAMLGKPAGEAVYPVVKKPDERALLYSYAQAKGNPFNMKFHSKLLIVSFDPAGIVTNMEYTASGDP